VNVPVRTSGQSRAGTPGKRSLTRCDPEPLARSLRQQQGLGVTTSDVSHIAQDTCWGGGIFWPVRKEYQFAMARRGALSGHI
jgi:hypothetical protein